MVLAQIKYLLTQECHKALLGQILFICINDHHYVYVKSQCSIFDEDCLVHKNNEKKERCSNSVDSLQ